MLKLPLTYSSRMMNNELREGFLINAGTISKRLGAIINLQAFFCTTYFLHTANLLLKSIHTIQLNQSHIHYC